MRKPRVNPYIKKLSRPLMRLLTDRFGPEEGARRYRRAMDIAARYWDETPYIGGRENILSGNLYMGEVIFAAVEACDRDFPGEDIARLADEIMISRIRALSRVVNCARMIDRPFMKRGLGRMFRGYMKKAASRGWDTSWRVDPDSINAHAEGISWRYTTCPLQAFARAHGMLEWMKYLCRLDYRMTEAVGLRMIRRHTLAAGDDECDYWIVR